MSPSLGQRDIIIYICNLEQTHPENVNAVGGLKMFYQVWRPK